MEKKEKGCVDLAKTLGRSFISGAYDIERRVHWSAFIYTEWSHYDNELYLEIHREKVKYKKTPQDYLVHWLQNGFIIHDDYGTDEYLSRDTIMPKEDNFAQGATDVGTRGITSIAKMKADMGVKDTPKDDVDLTPKPMTFVKQPDFIIPVFTINQYSMDTPMVFEGGNPYDMMNHMAKFVTYEPNTKDYIMPENGVTPFNS